MLVRICQNYARIRLRTSREVGLDHYLWNGTSLTAFPVNWSVSLFHVLKLHNLPPFFPTLFSTAPHFERVLPQIVQNVRIAFCGNGIIHLNIAEIHEGDIGGLNY